MSHNETEFYIRLVMMFLIFYMQNRKIGLDSYYKTSVVINEVIFFLQNSSNKPQNLCFNFDKSGMNLLRTSVKFLKERHACDSILTI